MKISLPLIMALFAGVTALQAQQNFTIQQATGGQYAEFAPQTYNFVQWRGNTHDFTYLSEYKSLQLCEEKTGWKPREITNLSRFKTAVKNFIGKSSGIKIDETAIAFFPYTYEWINDSTMQVEIGGTDQAYLAEYYPFSNRVQPLIGYTADAEGTHYSSQANKMAYTKGNNLFISDNSGKETPITNDADPGIVNGSDYVHRQEFGIDNGIFWSPKGNYVAWYRKDETMVAQYPLVNTAARIAAVNNIRYPMAGEKSEEVTLPVYNISTGQKITIKTGEPVEQYLTCITWDPSEKYIYIGLLNRGQNHLKLNKYDAASGDFISTLFEEQNPKYVEPLHNLTFLKTKPDQFIFQSEKDGFNHLYLYNTSGSLIKQLTSGPWAVTEVVGFDAKEENIYFLSTNPTPLERHLYSVNIKSGKMTRHTTISGTHSGTLSKDGAYWVDMNTSTMILNEVSLVTTKTNKKTTLLTSSNTYQGYDLPKMEMVTLTAADGKTPLYGRIIYPPAYATNKDKKFPVIVYVYGGPHAQLVTNRWLGGASLFEYYMAQQGFVMFTVDNRGSDNRGMEFESVIHRNLGVNEMADQIKGVEYLKTQSFVDPARIGVYGWSFGGFMSISLMLNYPDIFKVGVAGGPVCDWKYYEVMYGERYMDTPQENPDGYANASVIAKAGQLKGKLMVIHGAQDDVVVMQHSMEFINACIKKGKQVDYFLYPDHKHNVRGKDRSHLNQKIADYFINFLK